MKTIEILDEDFFNSIEELVELKKRMEVDKKIYDELSQDIKESLIDKWISLYNELSMNPGSVIFTHIHHTGKIGNVTFTPSDSYIKINKSSSDDLIKLYGNDIINKEDKYVIDTKTVEKYGSILIKMIKESDEIEEEDKENIINNEISYSIKKKSIDKLNEFGDVKEVMKNIKPVISLRKVEILD